MTVRAWGEASARPLVFWPGLNPWGSLQLIEVGPMLAGRGFRVISIAAPGAGESPPLDDPDAYLPSRLANLVVTTCDALDVERFAYMGASWGASIGVHLGALFAERVEALVLVDAGHTDVTLDESRDDLAGKFEADQAGFAFPTWDAFLEQVKERRRSWRDSLEPRYRNAMEERDGKIVPRSSARAAAWALHGVASEPPSSTHARLAVLRIPILLLIASNNDTTEALERFQAAVPSATIAHVESGHDVIEDAPDRTAELVADWLAAVRH